MSASRLLAVLPLAILAAALLWYSNLPAKEPASQTEEGQAQPAATETKTRTARAEPKPLNTSAEKGLQYLANQQHKNGGWGQGGGWRTGGSGRVEGEEVSDPPDVGSTCMAALALLRSGSTPSDGVYADHLAKAFDFVCDHIEDADESSPYVTDVRDTQIQSKIGQYVDTFLSALLLTELKGTMPDAASEKRLAKALKKTIGKIEGNQKEDGTFAGNHGWASVLSIGLCSKALNRAAQAGVEVSTEALARDFAVNAAGLNVATGDFSAVGGVATAEPVAAPITGPAEVAAARPVEASASYAAATAPVDAGVQLYSFSAKVGGLQEGVNTNGERRKRARQVLEDTKSTDAEKNQAKDELVRLEEAGKQQQVAQRAAVDGIIRRLDDEQFLAGFGNNGGEEFLSYMNISETMVVQGGKEWESWDRAICDNIGRVQNDDGSWSGQHCITGRTFCTAAALLTVMADRAPVPLAESIRHGQ